MFNRWFLIFILLFSRKMVWIVLQVELGWRFLTALSNGESGLNLDPRRSQLIERYLDQSSGTLISEEEPGLVLLVVSGRTELWRTWICC